MKNKCNFFIENIKKCKFYGKMNIFYNKGVVRK